MMMFWVVRICRGQLTKRSEYHKKISGFSLILSFTKFGYNETQDFIQVLNNFNEPWVFAKNFTRDSYIMLKENIKACKYSFSDIGHLHLVLTNSLALEL